MIEKELIEVIQYNCKIGMVFYRREKVMQERNYSVEFWRFFLCITFMLIHVFMIYPVMY